MSVFDDVPEEGTDNKPVQSHGNTRNWAHYQNLRRENPRLYYKPRTQTAMLRDRERLGKVKFYGSIHDE